MKTPRYLAISLSFLLPFALHSQEPVVSKDSVSVHRVERGDMPVVAAASGSIESIHPFKAALTVSGDDRDPCQTGRMAKVELKPSQPPLTGRVLGALSENRTCEVELYGVAPAGLATGTHVNGLVETGTLKNVVFFGRPADSSAYGAAKLFVFESGSSFANRTSVQYGMMSGPFIQVVSGLDPGDQVIVTDMSKWASAKRVRLE